MCNCFVISELYFLFFRSSVTDAIATAAGDDCIRIFEQVFSLPSYSRKENNENDHCEGGLDAPLKLLIYC